MAYLYSGEIRTKHTRRGLLVLKTNAAARTPNAAQSARIARRLAEQSGWNLAVAAGSQFAGLGSPFSDLDLYVVNEGALSSISDSLMIDSLRVDVIPVAYDWLFDNVRQVVPGVAPVPRLNDLERLARLALGEIVADDGRLDHLFSTLRGSSSLARGLVSRYCARVATNLENVAGFLALDDGLSATWMADMGVLTAASAVLAAHGDVYPGLKWVVRRWRRTIGDGAEILVGRADAVLDRVRLAQDLAVAAVLGSRPVLDGGRGRAGRDAFAAPLLSPRGISLHRPGEAPEPVSREELALWSADYRGAATEGGLL
jgi:hypothetical protein